MTHNKKGIHFLTFAIFLFVLFLLPKLAFATADIDVSANDDSGGEFRTTAMGGGSVRMPDIYTTANTVRFNIYNFVSSFDPATDWRGRGNWNSPHPNPPSDTTGTAPVWSWTRPVAGMFNETINTGTHYDFRPVISKDPPNQGGAQVYLSAAIRIYGEPKSTINVTQSGCTTGGTWNITPGSYSGTPNTVSPNVALGTSYSLAVTSTPSPATGYTISNSANVITPSSMTVFSNATQTFNIDWTGCPLPPPPPTVDIKANSSNGPITITSGQSANLTWDTTQFPTSCTASNNQGNPNWSGGKPFAASNSQSSGALTVSTTFSIFCSNAGGPSPTDSVVVNVTAAPIPPSTPTGLTATAGSCGTGVINLTWTASAGATSYNILRSTVSGSGYVQIATSATNSYSNNSGLTAGTTYYYVVRAVNANGASGNSTQSQAVAPVATCPPGIPATPTGLTATTAACGTGTINISWNVSGGATSYTLRDGASVIYGPAGGTSFSHTGLSAGSNHSYSVLATNGSGSSVYSSAVAGTAPAVCAPPPTVDIQGRQSGVGSFVQGPITLPSGSFADISWTSTNATSCSATGGWWVNSGNLTSGTVSGLGGLTVNPTPFGINCTGPNGSASDTFTVNIGATPVPVVTITANPTSGTVNVVNPTITWSAVNNPTSCNATGDWTTNGAKAVSGTQAQGILNTVKTYTYTLTCSNGTGASAPASATVVVSASAQPDLTANAPTPNTATVNVPQTFTAVINNIGSASTGASFNNFFQRASAPNGGGTITDFPPSSMSPLGPGASNSAVSSISFTSAGIRSVRVCADKTDRNTTPSTDSVNESDENNNCSPWTDVIVNTAASFNYSLSNNGNISLTKSSSPVSGQSSITETLLAGTSVPVTLTATGMPAGVSVTYANNPCSPNCTGTITFTVAPSTTAGSYPILVTGTASGGPTRTTSFSLIISNPVGTTVSVSPNPSTAVVGQNVTWTAIASPQPCTYVWTMDDVPGNPTTNPVSFTYQTTGTKNAQVTVNCGGSVQSAQGTVQINVKPSFEEF